MSAEHRFFQAVAGNSLATALPRGHLENRFFMDCHRFAAEAEALLSRGAGAEDVEEVLFGVACNLLPGGLPMRRTISCR